MEAKTACRPDKSNRIRLLSEAYASSVRRRTKLVIVRSRCLYDNARWPGKHLFLVSGRIRFASRPGKRSQRWCRNPCPCQLVRLPLSGYIDLDFGRAEDRFPRSDSGEEESPNTKGRDAA